MTNNVTIGKKMIDVNSGTGTECLKVEKVSVKYVYYGENAYVNNTGRFNSRYIVLGHRN